MYPQLQSCLNPLKEQWSFEDPLRVLSENMIFIYKKHLKDNFSHIRVSFILGVLYDPKAPTLFSITPQKIHFTTFGNVQLSLPMVF